MTQNPVLDPQLVDPQVCETLREVYDPCCRDKGISVVDMGLVQSARIEDGVAEVRLVLTSGWCPFASRVLTDISDAVAALPHVDRADVAITWESAWSPERLSEDARGKLRFLPPPTAVRDRTSYVAENWPGAARPTDTNLEDRDDR
jgi:metal-sulfur cluster biosynthetic enzyme